MHCCTHGLEEYSMNQKESREDNRFERLLSDEPVRKYLYEHHITPANYKDHEKELRLFFPDEASFNRFADLYMTRVGMLSYIDFMKAGQHMDVFLHPRYIQQEDHIHDFYEMKYQLSGSGTVFADSRLLFLQESDICLIPPYVPHRNEVYTDEACMINIVLPAEYLPVLLPRIFSFSNAFQDYFSLKGSDPAHSVTADCMHCHTHEHPEIRQIFRDLLDYYSHEKQHTPFKDTLYESSFERVFLLLMDQQPAYQTSEPSSGSERREVSLLVDHLRSHLEDATLTATAEAFHFSSSYMSRYIKRLTGYSFQTLLLILRMEQAARQLKETDLTVDQIAAGVGITGKTYFYKKFRDFYGKNPGEFRKT